MNIFFYHSHLCNKKRKDINFAPDVLHYLTTDHY
jgi:hypothetical protein